MQPESKIHLIIADDHPLVRAGVMATLKTHSEFVVAGQAANGRELEHLLKTRPCHLVLMDLEMGNPSVGERIALCQQIQPHCKILILSGHSERAYIQALRGLGIDGFVLKSEAPDCLLQAIRVVHSGSSWFSHVILQMAMELSGEQLPTTLALTRREAMVLEKMKQAKDNQTIADELSLSKQTVRRYATTIYEKLGVKNRVQAVLAAPE